MAINYFRLMQSSNIYCRTRSQLSFEIRLDKKTFLTYPLHIFLKLLHHTYFQIFLSILNSGWNGVQRDWLQQSSKNIQAIKNMLVPNQYSIIWYCNWMRSSRKRIHRSWLDRKLHRPISVFGAFWHKIKPHWNCPKYWTGSIVLQLSNA